MNTRNDRVDVALVAAWVMAVLLTGVAVFQALLAAGAPWGDMVYGGRAAAAGEALPGAYRAMSLIAVVILITAAWLTLARAGAVSAGPFGERIVGGAVWFIVAYAATNTVMNLAGKHPVERIGLASVTAIITVAGLIVVRSPRGMPQRP
jgi:hypothetical protein